MIYIYILWCVYIYIYYDMYIYIIYIWYNYYGLSKNGCQMTFRDGVSNDVWLKNQNDLHLIFPGSSNSEENLTFCFYEYRKTPGKELQQALAPVLCLIRWIGHKAATAAGCLKHRPIFNTAGPKPQPRLVFIQKLLGAWDLWIAIPPSIPWPMGFDIWKRWKFQCASRQTAPWSGSNRHFTLREMAAMLDYNSEKKNTWNQPIGPSHPIS